MFCRIGLRNLEGRGQPFYNISSEHGGKANMPATTSAPAMRDLGYCAQQ